jgi:signal peptidase II
VTHSSSPGQAAGLNTLALLLIAIGAVGIDQSAKALVVARVPLYAAVQPIPALGHLFNFTFITNTGAAFGLLPDRGIIFIAIALAVAVAIVVYVRRIPHGEWLLKTSLALQLGGAMGNLLDRIRLGYVVDFADFHAWPVFNFADTCIVVGVALLAYRLLVLPNATPHS